MLELNTKEDYVDHFIKMGYIGNDSKEGYMKLSKSALEMLLEDFDALHSSSEVVGNGDAMLISNLEEELSTSKKSNDGLYQLLEASEKELNELKKSIDLKKSGGENLPIIDELDKTVEKRKTYQHLQKMKSEILSIANEIVDKLSQLR